MIWNHRVIVQTYPSNKRELYFGIHEVYYDGDDESSPESITENAVEVSGETPDSLLWTLEHMTKALSKPILWGDKGEKFLTEYKP